ncbi:MAG: hypothetical protein ACXVH3_32720 [Solirubrobacteraceae bacterium]
MLATMLGGPDRTTLSLLANEWRGIERVDEALAARTGQVLITEALLNVLVDARARESVRLPGPDADSGGRTRAAAARATGSVGPG